MLEGISCNTTMKEVMENLCEEDQGEEIIIRLSNVSSKLYLTSEMSSNAKVSQQVYFNNDMQLWSLVPVEGVPKFYKIMNMRTSGVMTGSTSSDNGTRISISRDQNLMNQQWTFIQPRYGSYVIKNRLNGKVLDIPDGDEGVGVEVQEFTQNNGDNQRFSIVEILCDQ